VKSTSYWVTQFTVCAVFAVGLPALGYLLLRLSPEEPGRGVILMFCGPLFLGCLLWLVRAYRSMSSTQREIYAWAITQQHAAGVADDVTMQMASRAQAGTLRPDELQWLIDLNPGNPYPDDTRATHTGA
jgi:hypothetical protein